MRIIAGTLGGRTFAAPPRSSTHTMSEKARGGLLNTLGDISGLQVLDAFAGSGGLGFEALSRGAGHVVAIDKDRQAQKIIVANMQALQLGAAIQLITASAAAWLRTAPASRFDLILLDPPYDDVQLDLLQRLAVRLRPNGTLVLSWPGRQAAPEFSALRLVATNDYGDAQVLFYKA